MISFDKIVKKMFKKWWKIVFKNDIFDIIDPEKKPEYKNILNKTIYKLKALNIIISLKSWVYVIPWDDDKKLNKVDLLEKYYLKLLKKYITYNVWNSYYISWSKALEYNMKNFEVPEKIFIVNRSLNKRIKLSNYEIIFKTVSWKKDWKKINLYSKFSGFVTKKEIEGHIFNIAWLELSLVESSLVWNIDEWLQVWLLSKAIKKYWKIMDEDIFYEIWKFKYIMAFNRLKEISKHLDKKLYKVFLDIIKINWGLFIWEWLRLM